MSTDVTKRDTTALTQKPSYLAQVSETGVENMVQYVRPPRVKIVQPPSDKKLKDRFQEGTAIVLPQTEMIAKFGEPFTFTPIFSFPEWCVWNPLQMKATLPVIRERSLDPQSAIARLAADERRRNFPCPENAAYMCSAAQHINIVAMINTPIIEDIPVVMVFVRSELKTGSMVLSLIQLRKAHMCSVVLEGQVASRKNAKGEWYGFDFSNPSSEDVHPWNTEEAFARYLELHNLYKEAHRRNEIVVDHDDDAMVESGGENQSDAEGVAANPAKDPTQSNF